MFVLFNGLVVRGHVNLLMAWFFWLLRYLAFSLRGFLLLDEHRRVVLMRLSLWRRVSRGLDLAHTKVSDSMIGVVVGQIVVARHSCLRPEGFIFGVARLSDS